MRTLSLVALAIGCSGGAQQIAIGPPPPRMTQATLAGPLCQQDHCACRDANAAADGGVGVPTAPGTKRFEVRMGPSSQELWATIAGRTLYKSPERPEACFYVDLPAGDMPIELRGSDKDGVSAAWTIRELGAATKTWYDTFAFSCGSPGVCSFDELDSEKQALARRDNNTFDACGSTKVKSLTWDTGKAPDQLHPSELLVRLHLHVYKFAPAKAHGDPGCEFGAAKAAAAP
jgi:hypothetical protein